MAVRSRLFFLLLVVLILLIRQNDTIFNNIIKNTKNNMKATAFDCVFNPKRITNYSCTMKAVSRGVTELNLFATLLEPIRHLVVRFEFYKLFNGYRPFLPNMTEDWCEFMAGRRWSPFLKICAQLLKNTSNLNSTCPIEKYISIQRYKYVAEYFPLTAVVPKGKYKFIIELNDDTSIEPYICTFSMKIEVEELVQP